MASLFIEKIGDDFFKVGIRQKHLCEVSKMSKNVKIFKGKLSSVKNWLILHSIDPTEINTALNQFETNKDHNLAEFGVMGKFMFSIRDKNLKKIIKKEDNVIFVKF